LDRKLKLEILIVFQILKTSSGKNELANLNKLNSSNSTVADQAKHINTTNKNRNCEITVKKTL